MDANFKNTDSLGNAPDAISVANQNYSNWSVLQLKNNVLDTEKLTFMSGEMALKLWKLRKKFQSEVSEYKELVSKTEDSKSLSTLRSSLLGFLDFLEHKFSALKRYDDFKLLYLYVLETLVRLGIVSKTK